MAQPTSRGLVGVRFTRAGPVYFFDAGTLELAVHDRVVAQTEQGEAVGSVVIAPHQVIHNDLRVGVQPLLRRATREDLARGVAP